MPWATSETSFSSARHCCCLVFDSPSRILLKVKVGPRGGWCNFSPSRSLAAKDSTSVGWKGNKRAVNRRCLCRHASRIVHVPDRCTFRGNCAKSVQTSTLSCSNMSFSMSVLSTSNKTIYQEDEALTIYATYTVLCNANSKSTFLSVVRVGVVPNGPPTVLELRPPPIN